MSLSLEGAPVRGGIGGKVGNDEGRGVGGGEGLGEGRGVGNGVGGRVGGRVRGGGGGRKNPKNGSHHAKFDATLIKELASTKVNSNEPRRTRLDLDFMVRGVLLVYRKSSDARTVECIRCKRVGKRSISSVLLLVVLMFVDDEPAMHAKLTANCCSCLYWSGFITIRTVFY